MTFPTRILGRSGPQVSAIGFGTMSLAGAYGPQKSREENFAVIDSAHEIGVRFWDTADRYGDSKQCIGEWFKRTGKRDDIFLATKLGGVIVDGRLTERSDPDYIKEACEKCLATLGINTIDLLYIHRIDTKTPVEKSIQTMVELKKEGKIRCMGLSECSADTLRRAHAVQPISAYEVEYSPFCLDIESPKTNIMKTCRELGVTVVAYSPVGRGLLTGQIQSHDELPQNDLRRMATKYAPDNFPKILDLVAKFDSVAKNHDCTAAQICLAWLLAQEDVIPIPGTKTIKYLEQKAAAAGIHLSNSEVEELRKFAEATDLKGDRYPVAFMGSIFRDSPQL